MTHHGQTFHSHCYNALRALYYSTIKLCINRFTSFAKKTLPAQLIQPLPYTQKQNKLACSVSMESYDIYNIVDIRKNRS